MQKDAEPHCDNLQVVSPEGDTSDVKPDSKGLFENFVALLKKRIDDVRTRIERALYDSLFGAGAYDGNPQETGEE